MWTPTLVYSQQLHFNMPSTSPWIMKPVAILPGGSGFFLLGMAGLLNLIQIARFGTLHKCLWQSWLWHLLHGPLACQSLTPWTQRQINSVTRALPHCPCMPSLWASVVGKEAPLLLRQPNSSGHLGFWHLPDPLIMHLVCSMFFSAATNHYTVLVTHIVGTNNSISFFIFIDLFLQSLADTINK